MSPEPDHEQLALLKSQVRSRRPRATTTAEQGAESAPVAQVLVDLPLAHLDRTFDYLVPRQYDDSAVPGCRVKVRFAGRDVGGFLVTRRERSDHPGRLTPLRAVVSAEQVLTPSVHELAALVAERYAGTVADVLRLAVPPRHARVEKQTLAEPPPDPATAVDEAGWTTYVGGSPWLSRLRAGEAPRAVWTATAGEAWPVRMAEAAAATDDSGRGSLLCLPDRRDVDRVDAALTAVLGQGRHVVLTADLGPAARYRAFLSVLRGQVSIVVGTRAAAFAPLRDLGLVALWDDGDDLYAEPRAPYPHCREVLLLRAHQAGCAALLGGYARSVEAQALVASGWAAALEAPRALARERAPQVHVAGESDNERARDTAGRHSRMPRRVFEVVRGALDDGPVLVHSPRYGYQPALACATCREPARCERCRGPLRRQAAGAPPRCGWCDTVADRWRCSRCQATALRAPVVGALRTAEEWGRAFPQTSVVSSGGDHVVDEVPDRPAVVVATPGAEPRVDGGYAAAVLLDTSLSLARPGLRATEEAVRRWVNVAALVRPGDIGGRVVAVGDPESAALQALVRWDPGGFAARELADRESARLTPAARMATITATPRLLTDVLAGLDLPHYVDVLGPVLLDPPSSSASGAADVRAREPEQLARLVLRTSRERGGGLSRALRQLQAARSSRKLPHVRVEVDPTDLI